MSRRAEPQSPGGRNQSDATPVWDELTPSSRKVFVSALSVAFALMTAACTAFALQHLSDGFATAILYAPLSLTSLVFSVLLSGTVVMVLRVGKATGAEWETLWLGSAWILACLPLAVFLLFTPGFFGVGSPWSHFLEIVIMAVFAIIGTKFWAGSRNSALAFVLAPVMFVWFIVDGTTHLHGLFCVETGYAACPAWEVSDGYLSMIMLLLVVLTMAARDRNPGKASLALLVLMIAVMTLSDLSNWIS